jgi:ATP-binding protein involved in chromosome partitioning
MFGIEHLKPEVRMMDGKEVMTPVEKFGVKIMSIGFFIERNQGLIWRGPMAANAITQLFENTLWGDIDYMIVDSPPGTGDIQLTTVQKLNLHGVILVTTPQEIALNDARKAASMFTNHELNVPPLQHPGEKYFIFGQGGAALLASELKTTLLGQIPLVAEVGEAAEKGLPVYNLHDQSVSNAFEKVVEMLI